MIGWNVQTQVSATKATSRTLLDVNCLTLFYSNPMQTWLKFESRICISKYQIYICQLSVVYDYYLLVSVFLFDFPCQILSFKLTGALPCSPPAPSHSIPWIRILRSAARTWRPLRPKKKTNNAVTGGRDAARGGCMGPCSGFCCVGFVLLVAWWILC